jgi:hypothetical protein
MQSRVREVSRSYELHFACDFSLGMIRMRDPDRFYTCWMGQLRPGIPRRQTRSQPLQKLRVPNGRRGSQTAISRVTHVRFEGIDFNNEAIACRRNDCASKASARLESCPF